MKATVKNKLPKDWEVKELGEVFDFVSTSSFSRDNLSDDKTKNEIYYIHYGDIHATYKSELLDFDNEKVPFLKDEFHSDKLKFLQEGDLVIADASEDYEGIAAAVEIKNIRNKKVVGGLHTIVIRDNKKQTANGFKTYLFKSNNIHNEIKKVATGISVYGISKTNLSKIKLILPPLSEQTAIAALLATWDTAIQTTEKLIAQKELQKKALMQKLLSGKGNEFRIGDLGKTFTGLTGKNKEDFGEGKPYIPYLNIFRNTKIDVSNFDYVRVSKNDNQNKVQYGDIFFTVSSETPNEVGMASVLLDDIEELYLNSFCFGFRLHNFKTLLPEFSGYFLRSIQFRKEILKLSQGATRFNLSKTNLMNLIVKLPTLSEQQKIANILQTADKEIQLLKSKADNLKEQKKGLMQQLLTGKKRLKI